MTDSAKVWFITGASKGIGQILARALLAKGHRVAATSRGKAGLKEGFGDKEDFLGLEADLTDEHSVKRAIDATVERFGAIDVIVNNAGYGLHGTVEALSDAEYRRNFDVNVFAPLNVLRHALPYSRARSMFHLLPLIWEPTTPGLI